ncbi:MAG: SIS domain-containing protein [Clostridia bacterium]|nr:SIS domain-containing protein [Clostridia bacterium]
MIYDFEALAEVFRKLPEDAAERAASSIRTHRRVFVYGAGRSGLMLKALAMRLSQADRTVYVVGETVTPAITEGDLLILASASGNTASVCRYAETAKEAGADLLILTASQKSKLTEISGADVCFRTPTKDDAINPVSLMGTLFEQALLLFCDRVILCLNDDFTGMRKRHANLE